MCAWQGRKEIKADLRMMLRKNFEYDYQFIELIGNNYQETTKFLG